MESLTKAAHDVMMYAGVLIFYKLHFISNRL